MSRESKKKFFPKMAFFTFDSKNGLKTQYLLKSTQKCNLNCGFRPVMKFSVRHALIIKGEGQVHTFDEVNKTEAYYFKRALNEVVLLFFLVFSETRS